MRRRLQARGYDGHEPSEGLARALERAVDASAATMAKRRGHAV